MPTKDIPLRIKYRTVLKYGKLAREKTKWKFTRNPFMDCPVIEMTHFSKWTIVNEVFDCIKSYSKK